MRKRLIRRSWKRRFAAGSLVLVVSVIASMQSPWVDQASAQGSVTYDPGVELHLMRLPMLVPAAATDNQWFARVGLKSYMDPNVVFRYVVLLHVPDEWELRWARMTSSSGDFSTANLSKQYNGALGYIGTTYECYSGGAAQAGYKWRAWASPLEQIPNGAGDVINDFLANEVDLRGGLWVPSGSSAAVHVDFRMAFGVFFDSDGDQQPDSYTCDRVILNPLTVVP